MSLTRVTDNVVTEGTITPAKLSTGAPTWDGSGVLSAVGFVGDGSALAGIGNFSVSDILSATSNLYFDSYLSADGFVGSGVFLTNVGYATRVTTITSNSYTIQPEDNFNTLVFNQSAEVFTLNNPDAYTDGHKTTIVQYSNGPVFFKSEDIFSNRSFDRTRGRYSKAFLQFTTPFWTVYGNLTSALLTAAPITPGPTINAFTSAFAFSSSSFLLSGTKLFAAGGGGSGRLGLNNLVNYSTFTQVQGNWVRVDAKFRHVGALSGTSPGNYDLYMVGNNDYGQLGLNTTTPRSTFTRVTIPANSRWTEIDTGVNNSFALSGTDLYSAGLNNYGQLALNDVDYSGVSYDYQNRSTFTQVAGSWSSMDIDPSFGGDGGIGISGGVVYVTGTFGGTTSYSFRALPNPDGNWVKAACGNGIIIALSQNNRLWWIGGTNYGGQGSTTAWTQFPGTFIDMSPHGLGSSLNFWGVMALSATGNRVCIADYRGVEVLPGTWSGIQFINSQTAKLGSTFYAIGFNYMDKFGLGIGYNGIFSARSTLTVIPGSWTNVWIDDYASYAVDGSNQLYFAGSQTYVNAPGSSTGGGGFYRSTFTQIPAGYQPPGTIVFAHAGQASTDFLVMSNGSVYSRGGYFQGSSGLGTYYETPTTFTLLPGSWTSSTIIKTGSNGTSYALKGSTLLTTGQNQQGELGLGLTPIAYPYTVTLPRSTFTKVAGNWNTVSIGDTHALALSGTRLHVVGYNKEGQLGTGDKSNRSTLTLINGNWNAIATGHSSSYALSGNRIFATGNNSSGQLGLNDRTNRNTFTVLSGNWTAIVANGESTVGSVLYALSGTNLFVCGSNADGELGLNDTRSRSTLTQIPGNWAFVATSGKHAITLSAVDTGRLIPFGTGRNGLGELGLNDSLQKTTFITITAG